MAGPDVQRCEVYDVDPDPVKGREQAGRRPMLVVSIDAMNRSAAEVVIGAPITTTDWGNSIHVRIDPSQGGLERASFAMPEMVRSVSTHRLGRRRGLVAEEIVDAVAKRVGILLGLGQSR